MQTKAAGLIVLLALSISATQAECPRWERLKESGQKAIDDGNYKRAEPIWISAVKGAQNCGDADPLALGISLKKLGEVYMKNAKYQLAESTLKQAAEQVKTTGKEDPELTADLAEVGKNYRSIDFLKDVKPAVADLFTQAGVKTLGILKLTQDQGNRILMSLGKKFTKKIDNPDVDQVGLDKIVSFDIVQEPDGALMISKIKGLKVRAKWWVNIVQSHVKPKDAEPSADVTATAMGISKTVNCKLPSEVMEPINTFVAKLDDFTHGGTGASSPDTASTSVTGSTTTTATGSTTTATTGSTTTPTAGSATTPATESRNGATSTSPETPSTSSTSVTSTSPTSTTSATLTDAKPVSPEGDTKQADNTNMNQATP